MELCYYAAGCLGGSAGILVGHPLDTIKVRLQTSDCPSVWPCVRQTYRAWGVSVTDRNTASAAPSEKHVQNIFYNRSQMRGFFRGLSFPLVSSGAVNCIFFGVYGHTCRLFGHDVNNRSRQSAASYLTIFGAGCVASVVQLIILVPVDVVKVRMQADDGGGQLTGRRRHGSVRLFSELLRSGGFRACYRGFVIQAFRDIPSSGTYVLVYERLLDVLAASRPSGGGSFDVMLAGGIAGSLSWLMIAPLDVLKSRIQSDSLDQANRRYAGIVDCARKTANDGGLRVFFRGVGPVLVRAFPTNAVTFLIFTWSMELCLNH